MELSRWIEWCAARGVDPLSAPSHEFDAYLGRLIERYRLSTVGGAQTPIRGFYDYLLKRGLIVADPIPAGWRLQMPRSMPERTLLPDGVVTALIDAADERGPEYSALLRLLVEGMMKTGEIKDLEIADIRFEGDHAVLSVDADRFGSVAERRRVGDVAARALRIVIGERRSGRVFVTENGSPLTAAALGRRLDGVATRAGMTDHVTAQDLRRTALARMYGEPGIERALPRVDSKVRPKRMRALMAAAEARRETVAETGPLGLIAELLALSDVLLDDEDASPIPAIVLTGTAVELFLKRLALAHGSTNTNKGIEAWNSSLKSLGVIDRQEYKQGVVWGDLRNNAVHDFDTWKLTPMAARHMNEVFGELVKKYGVHLRGSED